MTADTDRDGTTDERPGAAGAGLGGAQETGPAAGSGDGVIADVDANVVDRVLASNDGPAGSMDSSVGDLDEAGG